MIRTTSRALYWHGHIHLEKVKNHQHSPVNTSDARKHWSEIFWHYSPCSGVNHQRTRKECGRLFPFSLVGHLAFPVWSTSRAEGKRFQGDARQDSVDVMHTRYVSYWYILRLLIAELGSEKVEICALMLRWMWMRSEANKTFSSKGRFCLTDDENQQASGE